jgi:hypothetical protein
MATDKTMRETMIAVIAQAIRDNDNISRAPMAIADEAMAQSGLRRALWSGLTMRQRNRIVALAIKMEEAS